MRDSAKTAAMLVLTLVLGYMPILAHGKDAPPIPPVDKPAAAAPAKTQDSAATQQPAKAEAPEKKSKDAAGAQSDVGPPPPSPHDQAVDAYNDGLRLFGDAQFNANQGNISGQEKLLKAALKKFQDAADLDPDLVESQSNIGYTYLTLKDYKKAIEAFNAVLAKNPHHLNTLNGLATAYAFDNQIDEAAKTFDTLTLLAPDNPDYLFNYGSVLQKAGRFDAAVAEYERALKVEPHHQRTLFNLATLYQNQGKLDQAREYYEQAKSVDITGTIGLESLSRLKEIEYLMNRPAPESASQTETKSGAPSSDTKQTDAQQTDTHPAGGKQ